MARLPLSRRNPEPEDPLVVAMTGVRLGERVIFAGTNPDIAVPLARKVGLSGQLLLLGGGDAAAAIEKRALGEGVLVERIDHAPPAHTFDVGVVEVDGEWESSLETLARSVRPGGRVVAIIGAPRRGWMARFFPGSPPQSSEADVVAVLARSGWLRARAVGTRDGISFVEAFARSSG